MHSTTTCEDPIWGSLRKRKNLPGMQVCSPKTTARELDLRRQSAQCEARPESHLRRCVYKTAQKFYLLQSQIQCKSKYVNVGQAARSVRVESLNYIFGERRKRDFRSSGLFPRCNVQSMDVCRFGCRRAVSLKGRNTSRIELRKYL